MTRDLAPIADVLEQDILFGRLRPRERLIEDELMQRTGATRHAVRQALLELEARHLVTRVPNRGAQVRDFSPDEVRQICEMRDLLHERAALSIALPIDPEWLARLEVLQAAHDEAVRAGSPIDVHRTNTAFHAALFGGCRNQFLTRTINDYAQLSLAYRCHLMTRSDLAEQAREEHHAMLRALRAQDLQALSVLCVSHTKPAQAVYETVQGWRSSPG